MADLQSLLKYQEIDAKLKKIEQEISGCDEKRKYFQARKFLESAGEKLDAIDARALELKRIAQILTKKFIEMNEILKEFSNVDELISDGGDIAFYVKNAQALSDGMKALKTDINGLIDKINDADAEYKKLKSQTIKMQKQYNEYKEKYGAVKESKKGESESIQKELAELEKNISPEVMVKYKNKRRESIFPILCQIKNDRCSMCGMELPLASMNKLNGGEVIECDNCHRIIYGAK